MTIREQYTPGPASGAQVRKDGEKWTLVLVRELRHSPEKVWQALTDPAQLREWAPFEADGSLGTVGTTVKLTTVGAPTPHVTETTVTRADAPKVLEYNVRLGDPEAQALLPRLKSDLFPLLREVSEGHLGQHRLEWTREPAVTVVMASSGYPGKYETGKPIEGLDEGKVEVEEGVFVFHAGTSVQDGKVVTSGGRVCAVTGLGQNLKSSIDNAYRGVDRIRFEGRHFRKDIGSRALARLAGG